MPIVDIQKADRSMQICWDCKVTVNPVCKTEQCPLLMMDNLFVALNKGGVYSTLNLSDAYSHTSLDEEPKKLTVINIHRGVFCLAACHSECHRHRLIFSVAWEPCWQALHEYLLEDCVTESAAKDCSPWKRNRKQS